MSGPKPLNYKCGKAGGPVSQPTKTCYGPAEYAKTQKAAPYHNFSNLVATP